MSNVLLERHRLPPFNQINPEMIESALDQILSDNRAAIAQLQQQETPTWDSLVQAMSELDDRFSQMWSPVSHLNSVVNSEALRAAYNACLPKLSQYSTEIGQNEALCNSFKALKDSANFAELNTAQQKAINNTLRDFHLSGIDLPADKKQRYGELKQKLSELTNKFSENVLDATQGWHKQIKDEAELVGLPESAKALLQQIAKEKGLAGWVITLDFPAFHPVMTYADNRDLREELYTAYVTRASDQGPTAGQWDNGPLIDQILALRYELAQLLGFDSYAQYSIATKMATSTDEVLGFLNDLAKRSVGQARAEFAELQAYAKAEFGAEDLKAWDAGYYSEKLRQQRYAISQEALRPYFPAPKVTAGMFEVVKRLYGIDIEEQTQQVDRWHEDVRYFVIKREGQQIASFYLDLYARANKRGGAWMDECRVRRRTAAGELQLPVAYLVCNFSAPVGGKPALLTHDEVTTLFHEFGHGLHQMLTQVEVADVSGINGVAWDAVELPSQFMENFCYEKEGLDLIAGHVDTGEALPQEMLDKLQAAKNFQSAMMMVRQLEFALFDFRLHHEYQPDGSVVVQKLLDEVRAQVAVLPPVPFNRFQNSFSHIFAGGYAAGYYSYKWAEVLSADAFSRFEEEGIFNPQTGADFLHNILEMGGSKEPAELFKAFRGREPKVDALLRHSGIQG
ncbi:oligopeptidase A [Oceanospirillum multiglobuliferum]|uniref:oligopeptidase A n=1 Tax=Oceanospirillum multiglobuliferum TaxID=64969 RepID=A0A1T4SFR8_9GAMM|nr:oligopeptidase A [Oceanospirillum multiglobuliferum]OPX54288.1 oligopeptidase A [Oceanospirillum multiglobuliferum]SKA26768.1 oligopeptidase A [Oceanospirillum multiglobuliferum]